MADESSLYIGRVIVDNQTQDSYPLMDKIGTASAATVFIARYRPNIDVGGTKYQVSIKVISTKESRACTELREAIERRSLDDHNNIVGFNTWFVSHGMFCVVAEHMNMGSLSYIVSKYFKKGMPEDCIAISLREALQGLSYIHNSGLVHKTFSAADIFVDGGRPVAIKLATQVTRYKHDPVDKFPRCHVDEASASASSGPAPLNVAAPEAYLLETTSREDYRKEADIWLVGITALELAYGGLHVSDREGFDAIITKITKKNKLPTRDKFLDVAKGESVINRLSKAKKVLGKKLKALKISKDKKVKEPQPPAFSKEFEQMVLMCLENPEKRPTADELLQCDFFTNSKDLDYFYQKVVDAWAQIIARA